jgi:alpha-tubulin suppressor-like RCC1 family protein
MGTRLVAWRRATFARNATCQALARLLALALAAALPLGFSGSASATSSGAAAWGENASGELGNATTARSQEATPVAGLSGVTAVAAGSEHSLALLADGTVMAWGNNRSGQLGNGSTTSSDTPVLVSGLGGVSAIAAGRQYSLALLTNGTVMAWGSNEDGQLGVGSTKPVTSTKPVAVKGITSATAIAAGASFAVARLSDGTVVSWGAGDEGQLGNGKMAKSLAPVMVAGLSGVTAVAAGEEHALALLANGTVASWGSNSALQLGMEPKTRSVKEEGEEYVEVLEEPENSDVPVAVQALSGVTAIAAGARHSLALLGSGEVMAWGSNAADQLGNGAPGQPSGMPSPVHGLGGASAIAAGANHSFALLSGGTVLGWGYNAAGQLGDGAYTNSPLPVPVTGLSGVAGIAGGAFHSVSFGAPVAGISGVSPASGAARGATSVAITGSNFGEAIAVHFGANPASTFTVNSPTSITASSPAGVGVVNVTVTTPSSTSAKNAADAFTYVAPPRITGVSPKTGPTAGGTSVTIKGASFGGATGVSFSGASSTSFTVNSPSSITAVSPPAPSGKVAISVTTPFGTSESVLADTFKYAAPTITSLSPSTGPHQGGTVVTVLGTGFSPAVGTTMFKFGAAQATSVSCESMTRCTFTTPARKPGVYDVAAVVGGLKSAASPPGDQFTFQ